MAKRTNYLQLALDLRRGLWLIDNPEALMPVVNQFLLRAPVADAELEPYQCTERTLAAGSDAGTGKAASKEPRVVIVPLVGQMTKYDTCETYGTDGIAAKMLKYASDERTVGVVLDIDSGGGAASAVPPLIEAIAQVRAAGKPVIAHCDSCYSAAYWVASQCDAVFLDNEISSGAGSIGAFAQILDDREDKQTGFKVITVYAPQSSDKNIAYREALDGKPARMQKELSDLVKVFHSSVRAGRPRLKEDAPGVMTGATFMAKEAVKVGLADGMATLEECVQNAFIRAGIYE